MRHLRWTGSLLLSFFVGCDAGPPPASIESAPWNDDVAAKRAVLKEQVGDLSEATRNLEQRLLLSEEGRLLMRAIRAHGGWDAWLLLPGLSYTRTRQVSGSTGGGQGSGGAADAAGSAGRFQFRYPPALSLCPCATKPHAPHFGSLASGRLIRTGLFHSKRQEPAGEEAAPSQKGEALLPLEVQTTEVAEEFFLSSLPFLLQDPGLLREYLGYEDDVRGGVLLERIRCRWPAAQDPSQDRAAPAGSSASAGADGDATGSGTEERGSNAQRPNVAEEEQTLTADEGKSPEMGGEASPVMVREARLVAWFDRTTHLLRRVLLWSADGQLALVVFSDWAEFLGVQFPRRREVFHLRRPFDRWDPAKPAIVDLLRDFSSGG